MNRRERIIEIIGFNIELERAELMADEIIALFEPDDKVRRYKLNKRPFKINITIP